ncbi:MAG: polysaccharide deacetylase family protein [Thermoanaerobaculia bacterium]|nr:polysaccharide deacetylase family protein [Thermoanaerobaculia bacterium]
MPAIRAKGSPAREFVKRRIADLSSLGFGRLRPGTITHVETSNPVVALTFDDGPHPEVTPRLLDLLGAANAKATFFVVGLAAKAHPGILERAVEEGHIVANHSWDHSSFPLLSSGWRRRQLAWCQDALPPGSPRLFRPPWGHQTWSSRLDAARAGFDVVAWSVMAEDWLDDPSEKLVARVEAGLRPGAIALLHDALYRTDAEAYRDRRPTLSAVEALLKRHSETYRFVTIPELLASGRVRRWPWRIPSDLDWLRRQI